MIVMVNRAIMVTFSCLKILFHVIRYEKKGHMEIIKKFYFET